MHGDNKNTLYHDIAVRIAKLLNIALMTMPFVFVWYGCYANQLHVKFYGRGHWLVIGLYVFLFFMIGRVYDAFTISYNSKGEIIYSQLLSLLEVNAIMYIVEWLLIRFTPDIKPMLFVYSNQILFSILWSILSQEWYFSTFPTNKTVIIWNNRLEIPYLIERYHLNQKFEIVNTISVKECLDNPSSLDEADTVFLTGAHGSERNTILKHCQKNRIRTFLIPGVGDLILSGANRKHMFHRIMLEIEPNSLSFEYLIVKRIGDILLSLIGLVVFSPIILITAICIKLEDNGPVFYKQLRLTKNGKEFYIHKFRSMKIDAEKDGVAMLYSGSGDSRVTRVGRIIRMVRIDEIPQLINILAGDMSIVGPRAERPELIRKYEQEIPEFSLRLQVKAGLTGYAQVYGKYNTTPYDKLSMDLSYIANASVFEDIKIIFATVKILFMPESTEGVEKEKKPIMEGTILVGKKVG